MVGGLGGYDGREGGEYGTYFIHGNILAFPLSVTAIAAIVYPYIINVVL